MTLVEFAHQKGRDDAHRGIAYDDRHLRSAGWSQKLIDAYDEGWHEAFHEEFSTTIGDQDE